MKNNIIDFEKEYYCKLGKEYEEEQKQLEEEKDWRWAEISALKNILENLEIKYILDYGKSWEEDEDGRFTNQI